MGREYSPAQRRRNERRRKAARAAVPAAGPVTITRPDGTTTVEAARTDHVDRPREPRRPPDPDDA